MWPNLAESVDELWRGKRKKGFNQCGWRGAYSSRNSLLPLYVYKLKSVFASLWYTTLQICIENIPQDFPQILRHIHKERLLCWLPFPVKLDLSNIKLLSQKWIFLDLSVSVSWWAFCGVHFNVFSLTTLVYCQDSLKTFWYRFLRFSLFITITRSSVHGSSSTSYNDSVSRRSVIRTAHRGIRISP